MTVRDLTILGSSSQQPTRERNHGAYLLRCSNEGLLFDPGEGTQRQFIFAGVAPPCVSRIFISHFHGDHCLGLGSMLMRLNLDKVDHPIHCYYPASGQVYFDRLRRGSIYHEQIQVIEHPIDHEGIIDESGPFILKAYFLDHGIDTLGFRVEEKEVRKFDKNKLHQFGIQGPLVRELEKKGSLIIREKKIDIKEVSWMRKGDVFAYIADTLPCEGAQYVADKASLLLCESTYLSAHAHLALSHHHLTAMQAALIAKQAEVQSLVLTHFSARYQDLTPFITEASSIFPNTFVAQDLHVFPFPKS